MPRKSKRASQNKLLSHTRPPLLSEKAPPTLSSRATRRLIRSHHNLQKQLVRALAAGDAASAVDIRKRIEANGGLQAYQRASLQGQAAERGGDSSRVLIDWCVRARAAEEGLVSESEVVASHDVTTEAAVAASASAGPIENQGRRLRLLEVGSLRPDNACARSGLFDMTRIDLHSQHPEIEEQDFMQRPVPGPDRLEREGFDVVSLSLVLNYVSDAAARGEMLRRVGKFLRQGEDRSQQYLPGLFLVLPARCVQNSRYMDDERLEEIMDVLGYMLLNRKKSDKLVYWYWKYEVRDGGRERTVAKQELRKGKDRNNFAITLK